VAAFELLDLVHNKRSLRVEWRIAILILVETVLSLYKPFLGIGGNWPRQPSMDCRNKCGNEDNCLIYIVSSFADLFRESICTGLSDAPKSKENHA
jgi:hypothetical protein